MTTARDTFFSFPELLEHLAQFLLPQDHICLLQANHTINSILTSAFWRSLNLTNQELSKRLLASPEGLKAIGNNIASIRFLEWRVEFSWWYIYALWTYLNTTPSLAHHQIPTDALTHPNWGALTVPAQPLVVQPLPPLLSLTHYTSQFNFMQILYPGLKSPWEFDILGHNPYEPHQHHVLWLLRLNRATLTFIHLYNMSVISPSIIRDLYRTKSQLDRLRIFSTD
jgi:hypothetical protein